MRGEQTVSLRAAVRLCLFLVACSPGVGDGEGTGLRSNEAEVSKADFGKDWPLTVNGGVLACKGAFEVTFTTGGMTYAVNGSAVGTGKYADIDPIWTDDPKIQGLKKNIGPLIDRGLELCE